MNVENGLIDLKVSNDVVFQRLFGKVGNECITKGLLEAILQIKIKGLTLDKNKRMQLDRLDSKTGRLDVKAELDDGTIVHIEMQSSEYEFMEDRTVFYNDVTYVENIKKGNGYQALSKVISILISDYNLKVTEKIPKYHTVWNYREKDYPSEILVKSKEIHVIELNKFDPSKEDENVANWIKFLKVKEMQDMRDIKFYDEMLKKAKEELEFLASNNAVQQEYLDRENELRDTVTYFEYLKEKGLREGREKGIKEGREEGLKEGKEEGLREGKEEGLREGKEEGLREGREEGLKEGKEKGIKEGVKEGKEQGKIEERKTMAKKLLKLNFPIEKIIEITDLNKEEIENLDI